MAWAMNVMVVACKLVDDGGVMHPHLICAVPVLSVGHGFRVCGAVANWLFDSVFSAAVTFMPERLPWVP